MITQYENELKKSLLEHKDKFSPSLDEQKIAFHRFCQVLRIAYNPMAYQELPYLIKSISSKYSACRIAEVFFEEEHSLHGDQMTGNDLKRWAAIEIDELFNEDYRLPSGSFWHE
jgi:hypothetical protein